MILRIRMMEEEAETAETAETAEMEVEMEEIAAAMAVERPLQQTQAHQINRIIQNIKRDVTRIIIACYVPF